MASQCGSKAENEIDTVLQDADLRARLRSRLRDARAAVQADAEGFEVVVHEIEVIGRRLKPGGHSLNGYRPAFVKIVENILCGKRLRDFKAKYFLLRQTRNDYAHQGVHARQAADLAVEIALILEDALSYNWSDIQLQDVMVGNPVTAQACDQLRDVRRMMLAHAFSAIPVRVNGGWCLVLDGWLAEQLAGKENGPRREVLQRRVDDDANELYEAKHFPPKTPLDKLGGKAREPLILVVESNSDELCGVVAPADLL